MSNTIDANTNKYSTLKGIHKSYEWCWKYIKFMIIKVLTATASNSSHYVYVKSTNDTPKISWMLVSRSAAEAFVTNILNVIMTYVSGSLSTILTFKAALLSDVKSNETCVGNLMDG